MRLEHSGAVRASIPLSYEDEGLVVPAPLARCLPRVALERPVDG
ncbi:hypothetical protein OG806_45455 [Streptomyces sp. NBC_00882]|nr:hypothetical protein OG806_45455 [Streptomyces sp. NBC_00882]WSZ63083.1 hypothetical protein OH824_44320 [Streptomyces canus]